MEDVEAEAEKQIKLRDDARARSKDVMGFNSVFDQKKEVAKKEQLRRDKLTLQYELDLQKAQDDKDAAKICWKKNSTRGSRSISMGLRSSKVRTRRRSRPCAASSRIGSGRSAIARSRPRSMLGNISGSRSTWGGSSRSGTRSPPRSSPPVIMGRRSRPSRRREGGERDEMIEGVPTKNKLPSTTSRNYGCRLKGIKSGGPRRKQASSEKASTSRRSRRNMRLYCGERGRAVQHPPPIDVVQVACFRRAHAAAKRHPAGSARTSVPFRGIAARGRRVGWPPGPRGSCTVGGPGRAARPVRASTAALS